VESEALVSFFHRVPVGVHHVLLEQSNYTYLSLRQSPFTPVNGGKFKIRLLPNNVFSNPALNRFHDRGSKVTIKTVFNVKTSQLTGSIHKKTSKNNLDRLFRQIVRK